MIFTERTITVVNDSATINKPLILYRGDKNIELKITIVESQFKFRSTGASNVIETANASYAQLVINTPYNSPIFSEITATENGTVIFVISAAMIDEVREVGIYDIQIRLLDDNKQSRVTIPPVSNAIEIREPMAIEDGSPIDSNVVNVAKVNRALTTTSAPLEAFDSQGNYIKKTWGDGDPITDAALNKMEAGIDGVNKKVAGVSSQIKDIVNNGNATLNKIEVLEEDPTDNLYEGRIWIYKQPDLSCTSITLDQTNVELTANNKTVTLVATVEPSNTTDNIIWVSSATEVATVSNGVVTAKFNGSTTITASCGSQSATCNITVSGFEEQEISGLVLSLSGSDFTNNPQTTTLPDNSGNGNNFTASGFSYTTSSGSNRNGGIVFDGTDDKLSIARNNMSLNISNGFTIIFKGKINDLSQTNKDIVDMSMKKWSSGSAGQQLSLIYGYVSETIELYGDGLAFREGSQITMPDNGTHTIIYSYDGSTIKGYLDGSEVLSISRAISITLPIVELGIGGNVPSNNPQSYANITLNNFMCYSRALTKDEIDTVLGNLF